MKAPASDESRPRWQKTHSLIREAAATLIRHRGLAAPTVAEVMSKIGRTVGGFYAHWPNRAALFDEALSVRTRKLWTELLSTAAQADPTERAVWIVRQYLSRKHRDADAEGCLLPSVLEDVAVQAEPYRATLNHEIEHFAGSLGKSIAPDDRDGGYARALGLIALMIGGLGLARATGQGALSDAVLAASRSLAYAALNTTPRPAHATR